MQELRAQIQVNPYLRVNSCCSQSLSPFVHYCSDIYHFQQHTDYCNSAAFVLYVFAHQAQLKLADTLKKLGEHADKNGPKLKILKLKIFRGFELDQNWKVSLPYQIFLGLELDLDIAGDMAALKVTSRSYLDLDVQKSI